MPMRLAQNTAQNRCSGRSDLGKRCVYACKITVNLDLGPQWFLWVFYNVIRLRLVEEPRLDIVIPLNLEHIPDLFFNARVKDRT